MAARELQLSSTRLARDAFEVALGGELDVHDAPALERALAEIAAEGAERVLLDLTAVQFLDSAILGVFVTAGRRFDTLVVALGDPRVARVFELTGLDRMVRIEGSRAEALGVLTGVADT